MKRKLRYALPPTIAVGALLALTGSALGATTHQQTQQSGHYQRFYPTGLPLSSPSAATAAVVQYAQINQIYGQVIATQTGAASFNPSDYTAAGWGQVSASTLNTALSNSGSIVSYRDASSVGVKTVRIRNKQTGVLVDVMVRCGNPRLRSGVVQRVAKVKILKVMSVYVNKKFSVTRSVTCPSGNVATGKVTGTVTGWVKFRVHGWARTAKLYYKQQVNLKATFALKLTCSGNVPPNVPTPVQVPGSSTVIVQQTTIVNVCSGDTTNVNTGVGVQQGNCSSTTVVVPPPAPPVVTPPPPPPPVNHKPTGEIAAPKHLYVNSRDGKVCVDNVSDPDGDQVSVTFSVSAGSTYGSVFTQPGGAICQSIQAPSDPQQDTATAVLDDGRGGTVTLSDNFPVISDQF
ncbi:hypothetical protein HY857_02815 [Candidatus Saccharibacteria bacterium]|nr:hypothetical protein [Candidatus Saccharibacteria bacterium]